MTIKQLQRYAKNRGLYFSGEKNVYGFYEIYIEPHGFFKADTLVGIKCRIDSLQQ